MTTAGSAYGSNGRNDLYAEVEGVGDSQVGSGKKGRAKLGGILVNTNFVGGQWRLVVGMSAGNCDAARWRELTNRMRIQCAELRCRRRHSRSCTRC